MACVTVTDFLKIVPELATFGGPGSGTVSFVAPTVALDTFTVGAAIGTATAGPRVVGTDTWSTDGTTAAQLASFVAMLNDETASFEAIVTGLATTSTLALVTSKATGVAGDIAWSTSDPVDIVLDPLTALSGGTDQIDFYLECACLMVNPQCWSVKFECGVIQLAAHLMTVAGGGEKGAITSKKIDKISVGYTSTAFDTSDAAFASTKYGRNYLAMRETIIVFPLVGTGLPRFWPRDRFFGRFRR